MEREGHDLQSCHTASSHPNIVIPKPIAAAKRRDERGICCLPTPPQLVWKWATRPLAFDVDLICQPPTIGVIPSAAVLQAERWISPVTTSFSFDTKVCETEVAHHFVPPQGWALLIHTGYQLKPDRRGLFYSCT